MFNRQMTLAVITDGLTLSLSTEDTRELFDCDRFLADGIMMYAVCFCQVLV